MRPNARKIFDELQKRAMSEGHASADLVADNADDDEPGWIEWASEWLYKYAGSTEYFMVEDLITYLQKKEIYLEPHDNRAWGGITAAASKAGLIETYGFSPSRVAHGSPKRVWKSLFYVGDPLSDIEFMYDGSNTMVIN